MTEISTPARRMARTINALSSSPRTWTLYFGSDGRETGRREPQSLKDFPHEWEHTAGQGRRVTGRDIQDSIDARQGLANFLAGAGPDEIAAAGYGD